MSDTNSLIHHCAMALLSLFAVTLLFLLSYSYALGTEFVRPRPLVEYGDILLAQELDTSLGNLDNQLTKCIDAGTGNPAQCYCQHPQETQAVKMSYDKVLQARPKWKGKILFWKDTANMQSHNLVIPAIENQLKTASLDCATNTSSTK